MFLDLFSSKQYYLVDNVLVLTQAGLCLLDNIDVIVVVIVVVVINVVADPRNNGKDRHRHSEESHLLSKSLLKSKECGFVSNIIIPG